MAGHVTIRDCSCFDWPALISLVIECFPDLSPKAIKYAVCRHKENVRVLKTDGIMAGFYLYYPVDDGDQAWLDYIGVRERYRGQGIGARLLQDLEKVANQRGCSRIGLAVDRSNPSAIKLYQSQGYGCVMRREKLTFAKTIGASPALSRRRRRTATCGRKLQNGHDNHDALDAHAI